LNFINVIFFKHITLLDKKRNIFARLFFYIMRLHRNLVYTTIDSLNAIFNEGEYADKVVARALKKDKRWGSSDRKFVAETIYEVVRWKRLYAEIAEVREPFNREDLWRMFAVWAVLRGYPIPDWRQLEGTPERKIKGRFDELSKIRKMRESIPDWMDELGVKELGIQKLVSGSIGRIFESVSGQLNELFAIKVMR
jgi:hypothetical protein